MKINSFYTYDPSESLYERGGGPQIAVPDQSLSVREILERFRRGTMSPEEISSSLYTEDNDEYSDDDLDVFDPLIEDLTDLQDIVNVAKQREQVAAGRGKSVGEQSDNQNNLV